MLCTLPSVIRRKAKEEDQMSCLAGKMVLAFRAAELLEMTSKVHLFGRQT